MAEIYGLFDPETGALRYIGKANNSAKRLKQHLREYRRSKTPVYAWIGKLVRKGLSPEMRVLETADDWREAERRLIADARARGVRILNVRTRSSASSPCARDNTARISSPATACASLMTRA
jgi:hypothetical protein